VSARARVGKDAGTGHSAASDRLRERWARSAASQDPLVDLPPDRHRAYRRSLMDVFMRNLMATFAYVGKTLQAAQAMPMPVLSLMILLAGFLVVREDLGWLQFANW
jgi:cytochrome P450